MADEARLIAVVEANTRQFENALKRLEGVTKASTDRMTASVKKVDAQLSSVGVTMNRIGKAATWTAAIGAAKQLAGGILSVVEAADQLVDTADKLGITATQLKRLRYAAEQAGSSAGQMDEALAKLSKGLAEARVGSGDLRKVLLANGMTEAEVKSLTLMQALEKVRDIISRAKDASDRGKLSMLAFGKGADELGTVMENLEALIRRYNETQHDVGEEGTRWLASQKDGVVDLSKAWENAIDSLVLYFLKFEWYVGKAEHAIVDAIAAAYAAAAGMAATGGGPAGAGGNLPYLPFGQPAAPHAPLQVTIHPKPLETAKPSVVPSAGGGGGGGGGKKAGAGMTTITTKGGLKATVLEAYAEQFEGLLNEFEARTAINRLSSFRKNAVVAGTGGRPSQHRYGKAIDINPMKDQSPWIGMSGFTPDELRNMAARYGMRWGGDFGKRDPEHFDVMGKAPMGQEALNTAKGLTNEAERLLEINKSNNEVLDAANKKLQDQTDAIVNEQQAFKRDLLGGVIKDLERGVKPAEALANALQKVGDRLLDMALNSIFPDVVGGLAAAPVGGGIFGKLFGFAGGGVMGPHGPIPLKRYAGGGVANSPQIAMFGEGSRPEAFIPLPSGGMIPVSMRGAAPSNVRHRVDISPSPLFVATVHETSERAGMRAVASAGDSARRRSGGR